MGSPVHGTHTFSSMWAPASAPAPAPAQPPLQPSPCPREPGWFLHCLSGAGLDHISETGDRYSILKRCHMFWVGLKTYWGGNCPSTGWRHTYLMCVHPKHWMLSSCCHINERLKQALIRFALSLLLVPVSLLLVTKLADCQDASWRDELLQLFVCSYYKQWSESNPLGIVMSQMFFASSNQLAEAAMVNNFLF